MSGIGLVIVDDHPQLAARLERHRDDVHAFLCEELADGGERAGTVGEAQVQFRTN